MNIIIIHGYDATPHDNWFMWLKEKLVAQGHSVSVPQMPGGQHPVLEEWMKTFEALDCDENTVLIGHSLGCPFILNVLMKYKVKAVVLVAGFAGSLSNINDSYINRFGEQQFDWTIIKANCPKFHILHAKDDPVVPVEKAYELEKLLASQVTMHILETGEHLNWRVKLFEFPDVLEVILSL